MPQQSAQKDKDILKLLPPPAKPPKLTARRIGIHTSTAGGVANAAERAYRLGCNTLQIFSSSPRQWKPYELTPEQRDEMIRLRAKYDLRPLVIHANYLVNLAGGNPEFHAKSIAAFRGEMERALALRGGVPGAASGIVSRRQPRGRPAARGAGHRAGAGWARSAGGEPAHPHREHRRIGILAGWQLRAGCRVAVLIAQLRARAEPASTPATPMSLDTTSSVMKATTRRSINWIAPSACRMCTCGTATTPRPSADRTSIVISISARELLG